VRLQRPGWGIGAPSAAIPQVHREEALSDWSCPPRAWRPIQNVRQYVALPTGDASLF
jgi:hypothetical protein